MPIHPAAVHLPIALILFSVMTDVCGYFTKNDSLLAAGFWGILGAFAGCLLAVPTGLYDRNRGSIGPSIAGVVNRHMYIGIALLFLVCIAAIWRWTLFRNKRHPNWKYLLLVVSLLALTLFQGWLGGQLVFEYGVS